MLYSHPNKELYKHLVNTKTIATNNYDESFHNLLNDNSLIDLNESAIKKVISIVSLCHDFGKCHLYFQKYLKANDDQKRELKKTAETKHSLLSAVISFYLTKDSLLDIITKDDALIMAFIGFLISKRHHGNLKDINIELGIEEKEIKVMKKQIDSINDFDLDDLSNKLIENGLNLKLDKLTINKWIREIGSELGEVRRKTRKILRKSDSFQLYVLINFIFSLLIDGDKSEVTIGKTINRNNINFNQINIEKYKKNLPKNNSVISKLRIEAYNEVEKNKINLENKIYSLILPTGLGKTLTSLSFAFKLREHIKNEKNYTPRIIYSLPFLSIIDQNSDVLEEIFKSNNIRTNNNLLLKHHHLSEISYKTDETEFETDKSKILIEGWNSEIIVTTFIQLFHTLVSNKNSNLRKFHRLSGSIIILDEIQSIPYKFWSLVNKLMIYFANILNVYIIVTTATEPLIFSKKQTVPLVDSRKYYKKMDRLILRVDLKESKTVKEFYDSILFNKNSSYLFIFNTIKAAKNFHELLENDVDKKEITFLSTHITPYERIERIKKIKNKEKRIIISTQLIEAGVDIDFDYVYRDIAPLDSINQAAGRCNRNWNNKGEIVVVKLIDEKRLYASYIYDKVLIESTEDLLKVQEIYNENSFFKMIEKYYNIIKNKMSSDESEKIIDSLYKLKYDSNNYNNIDIKDFKLIDHNYYKLSVFVEIDEEAKKIWDEYIKLKETKEIFKRRLIFEEIKSNFYKYIISIPVESKNIPPEVEGFRYINKNSLKDYYDLVTGFKTKGINPIW